MASMPGSSGLPGSHVSPFFKFSQTVSKQLREHWRPVGAASALGLGLTLSAFAVRERYPNVGENIAALEKFIMKQQQGGFWTHSVLLNSKIASLSLSPQSEPMQILTVEEPKTGVVFPLGTPDGKQITGIGLRKKNILVKNITVYAYGVYADQDSLKSSLGKKYENLTEEEVKKAPELFDDVTEKDVGLTVRLVIVYGKLKIGAIRSAFEGSVGSGLKKFSGEENKELLDRFTSIFKHDMKLPRGTTIDISRRPGQVLQTKIDGQEIGSVQSPLLCRALFDLYLGEDAFDKSAKETMGTIFSQLLTT